LNNNIIINLFGGFFKNFRKKDSTNNNITNNQLSVNNDNGQVNVANNNSTINATHNTIIQQQKEFNPNKKIMYTNLGMLSPTFIGRDNYVKKIDLLLDKQEIIVLSGNGGIGVILPVPPKRCTRKISLYKFH
jgi:hypothetical protein